MKYLLFLIPSLAFANFVSESGNVTYAQLDACEKVESAKCYALPKDADTKSLADVEVDDLDRPIIEESEPILVDGDPRCEAPKEFDGLKCVQVIGYEKKIEKQFVTDPVKVKAKEDKKKAEDEKALSCEQFKALLDDSRIDDKSKAEDVMEVTRRLLGFYKECR
jgi:hypothetical protein